MRRFTFQPSTFVRQSTPLVRALRLVDVHVLGVDHIPLLLVLTAGPGASTCTGSSSCRPSLRARTGRLALVQNLGNLVHRAFDVLGRGAQSRGSAFVHGLLRVFHCFLSRLHVGLRNFFAVF